MPWRLRVAAGVKAYLLRDVEGPEEDLEVRLGRHVAGDGPHGARGPGGSERGPRAGEHLECVCVVVLLLRCRRWDAVWCPSWRWTRERRVGRVGGCGRSRGKVVCSREVGRRSFLL